MKYAHLFWRLFGLPITEWDDLIYEDFLWMKASADRHVREQEKQDREVSRRG